MCATHLYVGCQSSCGNGEPQYAHQYCRIPATGCVRAHLEQRGEFIAIHRSVVVSPAQRISGIRASSATTAPPPAAHMDIPPSTLIASHPLLFR